MPTLSSYAWLLAMEVLSSANAATVTSAGVAKLRQSADNVAGARYKKHVSKRLYLQQSTACICWLT
jgi:hypothetical protein